MWFSKALRRGSATHGEAPDTGARDVLQRGSVLPALAGAAAGCRVLVVVTMGCPACELLGLALRRAVLRHHWHLTICAATAQECADYLGEVALPAGTPTLTIAELPCRLPGATPLVATVDRSGVVLDVVTSPTVRRITRSCAGDRAAGGSRLQEHGVVG